MTETMLDKLPNVLLDNEGYPTEEWLNFIRNYQPDDSLPLITFIKGYLSEGWYFSGWGFKLSRKYRGKYNLELHTGGWSGNKEIINAILSNIHLTRFKMMYVMWKAGGHYYFEIKDE
jgi:hypothetical protein